MSVDVANAAQRLLSVAVDTTASMQLRQSLGFRCSSGQVVEYGGDTSLMYLVGHHVSIYPMDTHMQRYILKAPRTHEVLCFTVSSNRKYIALAERTLDGLQVSVYTQVSGTRVRTLEFKYLTKLPIVSMSFSTDNKYLTTVTSLPDVFIYVWQVDKSRLVGMASVPFEVTRVTVSPWAYWSLCSTGPTTLRLWRLVDKQLRQTDPLPRKRDGTPVQAYRFTAHTWSDEDCVLAATEEGDVLVVQGQEVTFTVRDVCGEGLAATAIIAAGQGFVVGGSGGILSHYERSFDDAARYTLAHRWNVGNAQCRVLDVTLAPKGDHVAVATSSNALTVVPLDSSTEESSSAPLQPLAVSFHASTITAVDLCIQRSFLLTASSDHTVRLYNLEKQRVEFVVDLEDEVLSVALHPSGLTAAVGLKSSTKMYAVLNKGLHAFTEFPVKPCYELRFCRGGQYVAAAVAHRIVVFNSYDFQCIAQLNGHTTMVRCMSWSANDHLLTSVDLNGSAFVWELSTQRRSDMDEGRKNISLTGVCHDSSTGGAVLVGCVRNTEGALTEGEMVIRGHENSVGEPSIIRPGVSTTRPPAQRRYHTCEIALSLSAQTLFVGLPTGAIGLYRYPISDDAQPYHRFEAHRSEITFLALSHDERCLVSIGEDHTALVFDVDALCEGRSVARKPFGYAAFDDVCYTLQSDIDEKERDLATLQDDMDELQRMKTRESAAMQQRFEHERATLESTYRNEIRTLTENLTEATTQRQLAERAVTENASMLEALHLKAAEELEALYTKRTEEANARFNSLKVERDDLIVRYESHIFNLEKEQAAEIQRIEERARQAEAKLLSEIEAQRQKMASEKDVFEAMLDQAIIDYETSIDDIGQTHRDVLEQKDEQLSKAVNSSSTGERDAERLRREKRSLLTQIDTRDTRIGELEALNEKRKRENEAQRKEMNVRFESITTAEKKIQQLKKHNTELEKLRYVLTFKFNELKKEVAPKEKQIEFMTQRVADMDRELEKVSHEREQLRQVSTQKEEKLKAVQRELTELRSAADDKERAMISLLRELGELVATADAKRLIFQVRDVVDRFSSKKGVHGALADEDKTAEFERHREYMEAQLACVRRQTRLKELNLRGDNQRNTAENAMLVREINDLRHEKKQLQTRCALVEAQLKEARLALQRSVAVTPTPAEGRPTADAAPPPLSPVRGPPRGRLIRGPTRSLRDASSLDAHKIAEVIAQVERNNMEMQRQQDEVARLREFVVHLLSRADASRMSADDAKRAEEIRRHVEALHVE